MKTRIFSYGHMSLLKKGKNYSIEITLTIFAWYELNWREPESVLLSKFSSFSTLAFSAIKSKNLSLWTKDHPAWNCVHCATLLGYVATVLCCYCATLLLCYVATVLRLSSGKKEGISFTIICTMNVVQIIVKKIPSFLPDA